MARTPARLRKWRKGNLAQLILTMPNGSYTILKVGEQTVPIWFSRSMLAYYEGHSLTVEFDVEGGCCALKMTESKIFKKTCCVG